MRSSKEDHRLRVMTDREQAMVSAITDHFCVELGRLAAKILASFQSDIRGQVLERLQEAAALYKPLTHDNMIEELKRLDGYSRRVNE